MRLTSLCVLAVPFRNSSLTKLLKNALGGNSKTIMVSGSGLGARGSGLGARGSGLGARGSGLGARGSGLGARGK